MKNNKGIDNKMKAKRLAAYALAASMTVTIAPLGAVQPVMAEGIEAEILAASNVTAPDKITFEVKNNFKVGMKFADAKVILSDTATEGSIGNVLSDSIKIYNSDKSEKLYDTADPNTDGTVTFETGKTYVIEATFDYTASGITGIDDSTVTITNKDIKYTKGDGKGVEDYKVDFNTSASTKIVDKHATEKDASGTLQKFYRNGKGEVIKETTVVQDQDGNWVYIKDGVLTIATNKYDIVAGTDLGDDGELVENENGLWFIESGTDKVSFNKTGVVKKDGEYLYFANSKFDKTKTGVVGTYNLVNGKASKTETIVQDPSDGLWKYYDEYGKFDNTYSGFCKNPYGTWYVSNGVVTFNVGAGVGTIVEDTYGKLSADKKSYFVINSKVDYSKNGFILDQFNGNYVNVKNGVVDPTVKLEDETVIQDQRTGMWIAIDKNGNPISGPALSKNAYGVWAIDGNGFVDFTKTGIVTDTNRVVSKTLADYYVENGKVQNNKSGIVIDESTGDIVYMKNGKSIETGDILKTTVEQGPDGNWYVIDKDVAGGINLQYGTTVNTNHKAGFATNAYGTWYVYDGKVAFTKTGVVQDSDANISSDTSKFYYVEKGKVILDKNGIVVDGNNTYVFKNGTTKIDETLTSVIQDADGNWYYVKAGQYDNTFTGLAKNDYGTWYVDSGKVDFNKTGVVPVDGSDQTAGEAYVENGKMSGTKNGIVAIGNSKIYVEKNILTKVEGIVRYDKDGVYYYVDDKGYIDSNYTDFLVKNDNGIWLITNGKVDTSKDDVITVIAQNGNTDNAKGTGLADGAVVLVQKGMFQKDKSIYDKANTRYFKNGVVTPVSEVFDASKPTMVDDLDGKKYALIASGVVADGTYKCIDDVYRIIKGGELDTTATSIQTIGSDDFYFEKGLQSDKSGLVKVGNDNYMLEKGKVLKGGEPTETTINMLLDTTTIVNVYADTDGTMWYVDASGKIDVSKNLIGKAKDGKCYNIVNGKVSKADVATVGYKGMDYKVVNGVATEATAQ